MSTSAPSARFYSYTLGRDASLEDFASAWTAANAAFVDAVDETDLVTAAEKDELCCKLLDELTDAVSREGTKAEKILHVLNQAETSTKERAETLREMIAVRHRTRKAARELALTKNGYVAAVTPPHLIGETAPHGHIFGVH